MHNHYNIFLFFFIMFIAFWQRWERGNFLTFNNMLFNLKKCINYRKVCRYFSFLKTNMESEQVKVNNTAQVISEGLATIKTSGKVFYNPVQEFNRDLRYLELQTFYFVN